ncbi:hypothetical protein ZWY2020_008640 [Hordeum vulgare]|nr:hypothetical protein ZWY2020_008640 [Hordeum vulgare]
MGPVLAGAGPGRGPARHPGERAPRRRQPGAHVRAGAPLAGRRGRAPAQGQAAHGAVARPRPRRRRVPPDVAKEILDNPAFAARPLNHAAYGLMFHRSIGFAEHEPYWRALRRVASGHLFGRGRSTPSLPTARASPATWSRRCAAPGRASWSSAASSAAPRSTSCGSCSARYDVAAPSSSGEWRSCWGWCTKGTSSWGRRTGATTSRLAAVDPQGIGARCAELMPRVNRFVHSIIREHRAKAKATADGGGARLRRHITLPAGQRGLTDADIAAVLWEMIFRGTDAMAVLMEWTMARLVLHRDVQAKVHRPLLSWRHRAITDTYVDGHLVPAGTTAMVNQWAMSRDPEVWDAPLEFRPERFLAGGEAPDVSVLGADGRLVPFGSGRRSCPGKSLAMTTVTAWMAALLQEFEWAPAAAGVDLSEVLRLSCEMAAPLQVRVRPRGDA